MLLQTLKSVAASPSLEPDVAADVMVVISNCDTEIMDMSSITTPNTRSDAASTLATSSEQTPGGEHYVDTSVGSPGRQDLLTHTIELGSGKGTAGFLGKISEVSWLARAYAYLLSSREEQHDKQAETATVQSSATQFNYFTDDEDVLGIDEDYIDALHWPGDVVAQILCEAFFHALHGVFDGFSRDQFLTELHEFPRDRSLLSWDQRRWLAMANLVWAIGSKWLQRAMLYDELGIENHLVYYARARALGLDHRVMLDQPGLQGVKAMGTLAFYLFANGSINRAWALVGLAIRNATSLGLHLQAVDTLTLARRGERARVWYALYSLEVTMSEILGEPPSLSLAYTTVPLALLGGDSNDEGPGYPDALGTGTVWLEFLRGRRHVIQTMRGGHMPWQNFQFVGYGAPRQHNANRARLAVISNRVMTQLYMPNQTGTWAATQKRIGYLNGQLLGWEDKLPEDLQLKSAVAKGTDPRAKIDLALYYQSIRMILYRPCLCHIRIPAESASSKEFNLSGARACVYAGISMVEILPEDPTAHEVYQLLPWWNLLHYLGQAIAIFILELCLNMEHFDGVVGQLTSHVQKAMSYLWCLTASSPSSYKAWRTFRQILLVLTFRVGDFEIANIPIDAIMPTNWTDSDEATLKVTLAAISATGPQP